MGKTTPSCPTGTLTTREKLWQAMRHLGAQGDFDTRDLARAAGVDRHKYDYKDYMSALVRAGILQRHPPARVGALARYTLVNDTGIDAPRLSKNGERLPDSGQTRMWRAMKVLKTFSLRELVLHASLPEAPIAPATADTYCAWLERGGYLVPQQATGDVLRYRLVVNTGPKAPQILRIKALYDPNIDDLAVREAPIDAFNRQELEP